MAHICTECTKKYYQNSQGIFGATGMNGLMIIPTNMSRIKLHRVFPLVSLPLAALAAASIWSLGELLVSVFP